MTRTFFNCPFPLLIFLIGVVLPACQPNQPAASANQEPNRPDTINAFLLSMDSVQKSISLPGELLPNENVQIRAKVPGYVRVLKVDIGSKVRKGQVLAIVDAPEINTRIEELMERVKAAKAKYLASRDHYERINEAAKADGVIAPNEFQQVKNQMAADSSEFRAAELAASSVRQTGDYLTIVAPYSGTITNRNIVTGSFVGNAGDPPMFELEDDALLRLRVAVPEVYTSAELPGMAGELITRSLPDKKFKATLVRKSDIIDNQTRSEIWEFEVPNETRQLKAGSYADVRLKFLRKKPSFLVPTAAVQTTLEKKFAIRIAHGQVQWVDVRAGFNLGDRQEIFGDLQQGDTLALKASEELKPGTKVAVRLTQ